MIQKSDFKAEIRRRVEASGMPVGLWNDLVDARVVMYKAWKALRALDSINHNHVATAQGLDEANQTLKVHMRDIMGIDLINQANDGLPEKDKYGLADIRL